MALLSWERLPPQAPALLPLLLLLLLQVAGALGGGVTRMVPPTRTPTAPNRGSEGGFTGFRQIDKSECATLVSQWERQLGVVRGADEIERFEQLRLVGECALAMPGSKPQRRELMAFAEFEDGLIQTVALGYCTKVKCPWELAVLAVLSLSSPRSSADRCDRMAEFLSEMCKDNAIWPDFSALSRWSSFQEKRWVQQSFVQKRIFAGSVLAGDDDGGGGGGGGLLATDAVAALYKSCNLAPSVVIDEHDVDALPSFWFKQSLGGGPGTIYFRQKRRAGDAVVDEFEVRFEPPVTGVSSGMATVGCHLIIDCADEEQAGSYLSPAACSALKTVAACVRRKIKRPAELDAAVAGAAASSLAVSEPPAPPVTIPGASLEQLPGGRDEM